MLVYYDAARPSPSRAARTAGRTVTYWNAVTGLQTAGMWHGKPARFEMPLSEMAKKGENCAVLLQAAGQDGAPGPILGAAVIRDDDGAPAVSARRCPHRRRPDCRPDGGRETAKRIEKPAPAELTPVARIWDRRTRLSNAESRGWFDPAVAPWAGGLGFTEPVPDRTVSGNRVDFRQTLGPKPGLFGAKMWQAHHQFRHTVPFREMNCNIS